MESTTYPFANRLQVPREVCIAFEAIGDAVVVVLFVVQI